MIKLKKFLLNKNNQLPDREIFTMKNVPTIFVQYKHQIIM